MSVRRSRMATYKLLQEHRELLGWSIADLLGNLEGKRISERSVRRLEEGLPLRADSVNHIFNIVSKHFPSPLERREHIMLVQH